MTHEVAGQRPRSVTLAVSALSIALLIGVAILWFGWRVPTAALISLVLVGGLIFGAARRHNWARWTLVILTIGSTVLTQSFVRFQLTFKVVFPIATVAQLTIKDEGRRGAHPRRGVRRLHREADALPGIPVHYRRTTRSIGPNVLPAHVGFIVLERFPAYVRKPWNATELLALISRLVHQPSPSVPQPV